jgi:thioredoxin-like negative regulator of GroEL
MHFAPESLRRFNLVYENEHYRLFKRIDSPEPIFLTDHPPVYQRDIMIRNGDTYGSFLDRVNRLTLVYTDASRAAAAGDYESALRDLTWCLQQAPRFTRARVLLGSTLLSMGRPEEAKAELMSVIQYAPDNPEALYYAAFSLAQLGETEHATSLLNILGTTTRNRDLLERARLLQSFIDQGVELTPESFPQ